MRLQDLYPELRYGIGSIGENARVLAKEYSRLKSCNEFTPSQLCKNLLTLRFEMYKALGILIDNDLTERILKIADGYFPFIVFADTFVVNHNNKVNNWNTFMEILTIVVNIMMEEYNEIVDVEDRVEDQELLVEKIAEFLKIETGVDLYAE